MKDKVIEKIQKLFALANNNPSEEEAIAAALMAQKLMAKHNIAESDVNALFTKEEDITVTHYHCGGGRAWKFSLAHIVADNFRCKTFSYGRQTIAFYGYETDAKIARDTFEFLFKTGHRLADREVHRVFYKCGKVTGVYNSFCLGYMKGIKEELGKQCKALMIVIAPEVTEEYTAFSASFKKAKGIALTNSETFNSASYDNGRTEGRNIIKTKELKSGLA